MRVNSNLQKFPKIAPTAIAPWETNMLIYIQIYHPNSAGIEGSRQKTIAKTKDINLCK